MTSTNNYKITRNDDGTYLAEFEIEGTSKEELEEIFKRVKQAKKWTGEHRKDNIAGGFRKGKIKMKKSRNMSLNI